MIYKATMTVYIVVFCALVIQEFYAAPIGRIIFESSDDLVDFLRQGFQEQRDYAERLHIENDCARICSDNDTSCSDLCQDLDDLFPLIDMVVEHLNDPNNVEDLYWIIEEDMEENPNTNATNSEATWWINEFLPYY